jgi:Cft2 family RNA processing exonuclease
MGQTGYDAEEALGKLKEHDNDILAIVREYMGVPAVIDEPKRTVNQTIYKEMRGLMDNAASTHRRKKELEEQQQQYIEMMTRLRAAAAQNLRSSVAMKSITETDDDTSRDMNDASGN